MAEEEKEEEPKKGGLMKIIMMALGVIALIGIGIGAGYFLFGGKPADPSTEIEEIIERKKKRRFNENHNDGSGSYRLNRNRYRSRIFFIRRQTG